MTMEEMFGINTSHEDDAAFIKDAEKLGNKILETIDNYETEHLTKEKVILALSAVIAVGLVDFSGAETDYMIGKINENIYAVRAHALLGGIDKIQ